ncbi:hypothetical protein HMSLTHF_30860 [Vreelandella aquamarina]|uniref:Uncharacterized protein n=1 Tax=Vreelandella aquamarina TaxID=77097 RepID=A0A6F8SYJ7_9GAMM|nr:hypothetical protein HMSLTHF_30860 [Halomonas meridiana]
MHTLRYPLHPLAPKGLGAMHAGIVEHHNGEGVWTLLDHKLVKRLYDRFRRQSVSSRWVLSE